MKQVPLFQAIRQINARKTVVGACLTSIFCIPTVTIAQEKDTPVELDSLVVTGTKQSRYEFDETKSATGFNADIDDLPRTIQVIPQQLIIDQNSNDLTDVLSNAAAVTRSDGFGGVETEVNIRGFSNSRNFVDGSPVSERYNIDVADIESAEVILGPTSILHGQVSPGGLINIVTKKPEKESAHSIQAEYDEHGKEKLSIDSTGSLTETVQYRVVLSAEDSESFREVTTSDGTFNDGRESFSISPSFSFTPNDENTFTLRLNYTDQTLPIDRGTVVVDDGSGNLSIADLPRERRLGTELDQRESQEQRIKFDWDHTINDSWINKLAVGFYKKEFNDYQTRGLSGLSGDGSGIDLSNPTSSFASLGALLSNLNSTVQANGLLIRGADSNINSEEEEFSISDSLVGDYEIGGIENTIYIGANYNRRKVNETDGAALSTSAIVGGAFFRTPSIIDINSGVVSATTARADQTVLSTSAATFDEYGLSVQNLIKATDKLNILAGLRYDHFKIDNDVVSFFSENASNSALLDQRAAGLEQKIKSSNDNISGQFGIIYDLTDNASVYASYSDSFTPNYPSVTAGVISGVGNLAPEEATQYEIGVKSKFFDDKLRVSLSAYELTRENVLRAENLTVFLNGEEKTKGVDLTSSIQFIPGLNVLASYSYIDGEVVDDNNDSNDNEGNSLINIPENKARIWGSYEIQGGKFAGLGFGLGAEYVDSRFGDAGNTFELPSYTTYDTAVWGYISAGQNQRLRLQAGIKNLTDEEFFSASGSGVFRVNVGAPRTFYATARLEF